MKATLGILTMFCLLGCGAQTVSQTPEAADDQPIKSALQERIDNLHRGVGIVVGIIDEKGTRVISHGSMRRGDNRPVDADTMFEIGSVSKAFTGSLLAEMVQRKEVKLDDPVSQLLPASVKMPTRNDKQITLLDLATQSSGIARMPDNFSPADDSNPYADYTVDQMYEFLSGYKLKRDIGAKYEYSNLGVGLLGHVLALKGGTNYETLLQQHICLPLGMTNTVIVLDASRKARMATGHNEKCRAVSNWDIPTLAGAGGIRSTVNDLLRFVAANMGTKQSPLSPAFEMAHESRHSAGGPNTTIGLCWHITKRHDTEIIWHNGQTGGFHSFVGFDKKNKRGIVILSNTAGSIDDLGYHFLNEKFPIAKLAAQTLPTTMQLNEKQLDAYVGRYQLSPTHFFNLKRKGDQLFAQLTGQSYLEIYPESETKFFYEAVDAQLSFKKDADGKIKSLTLHQNGFDQTAGKISDDAPKEKTVIKLDSKAYDAYAGKYKLTSDAYFIIKRKGDHLLAQLTGQSFYEVFPESETKFYYKVVDAQLSFIKDSRGNVTALILHQNGIDQKANRLTDEK